MALLRRSGYLVKVPRLTLVGMALLVVLGCGEDSPSETSTPPVFDLLTQAQWSGGTVDIRSASFNGLSRLPVFTANQDTMVVQRLDQITLRLTLPVMATGVVEVILHEGTAADTVGSVAVYGQGPTTLIPGDFGYDPAVLPEARPRFLASGTPGNLAILDPATGQVEVIPGLRPLVGTSGIGQGSIPNRFVLRSGAGVGVVGVWSLFPSPVLVDSTPPSVAFHYGSALISDSVFMSWTGDWIHTVRWTPGPGFMEPTNDAGRIVSSPRGDWATVTPARSNRFLIPVVDAATGLLAFSLDRVAESRGAVFSPSGDSLFVSAFNVGTDSLKVFSATTGTQLASAPLPPGVSGGFLVADPRNSRLYLLGYAGPHLQQRAEVLIYDRSTLALEGRVSCPAACPTWFSWFGVMALDTIVDRLWIVGPAGTFAGQDSTYLVGYDLLP